MILSIFGQNNSFFREICFQMRTPRIKAVLISKWMSYLIPTSKLTLRHFRNFDFGKKQPALVYSLFVENFTYSYSFIQPMIKII